MKKLLIFILFTLATLSAFPQYVIDLSKFNYIDTSNDDIRGIAKVKGKYILNDNFYYDSNNESINFDTASVLVSEIDTSFLNVKDIHKFSRKYWGKLLEQSNIVFDDEDTQPNEYSFLVKKSPYIMLKMTLGNEELYDDEVRTTITVNEKSYNTLSYDKFYVINYLKLKNDKYVLLLIDENGRMEKFLPNENLKLTPFNIEPLIQNGKFTINNQAYLGYNLDIKQNKEGKEIFVDNYFKLPLGLAGDSIIYSNNRPSAIYHKKAKRYDLYDPYLNKVKHNYKIRALKSNSNWLTMLIGNDMFYLVNDTIEANPILEISTYSVCGTVNRYTDTIEYTTDKIKLKRFINSSMTTGLNRYLDYDIQNQSIVDSLFFFKNKQVQKYSDNTFNKDLYQMLLGKSKNGKYNIFNYEEVSKKLIKKEIKNLSIIERENTDEGDSEYYDGTIKLIPILDSDVDSIAFSDYPILFKQDGLFGLYPINLRAKYKQLGEPDISGFVRYSKPDGEQGWLDLRTKYEYADI